MGKRTEEEGGLGGRGRVNEVERGLRAGVRVRISVDFKVILNKAFSQNISFC